MQSINKILINLSTYYYYTLFLTHLSLLFFQIQAYAELEKDTPGEISGVTSKTDGKFTRSSTSSSAGSRSTSSTFSSQSNEHISSKYTQGYDESKDSYSEHDPKGTHEYRKENNKEVLYFGIGFIAVLILGIYYFSNSVESTLTEEREKVFERQLYEKQKRSQKQETKFDDV